jgi:hypothetical protein
MPVPKSRAVFTGVLNAVDDVAHLVFQPYAALLTLAPGKTAIVEGEDAVAMRREPAGKTRGVDVHHSGEARIDDQQRLLRVRLVGHIEGCIKLQAVTVKMGFFSITVVSFCLGHWAKIVSFKTQMRCCDGVIRRGLFPEQFHHGGCGE